jgi:hypothetical protein
LKEFSSGENSKLSSLKSSAKSLNKAEAEGRNSQLQDRTLDITQGELNESSFPILFQRVGDSGSDSSLPHTKGTQNHRNTHPRRITTEAERNEKKLSSKSSNSLSSHTPTAPHNTSAQNTSALLNHSQGFHTPNPSHAVLEDRVLNIDPESRRIHTNTKIMLPRPCPKFQNIYYRKLRITDTLQAILTLIIVLFIYLEVFFLYISICVCLSVLSLMLFRMIIIFLLRGK